jgi:Rod binding domain-containing protein
MEIPGQTPLNGPPAATGDQAERVRLEKSAREFEGVFLNTLLKAMRQTVPTNELFNGGGPTKFYQQMQDAEFARAMADGNGGMGIADMIVRQLTREGPAGISRPAPERDAFGPPAPVALDRYRTLAASLPETAGGKRLAMLARSQGAAVADTLDRFGNEIADAAGRAGLDPALILSVVMEESGGDPGALSPKGALGLMQIMPGTARELGLADPRDPAQNLEGGARYLAGMLDRFAGRLDVALAAYNAGPGTVDRHGGRIPDYAETKRYVNKVLARYENLGGGTHLATVEP